MRRAGQRIGAAAAHPAQGQVDQRHHAQQHDAQRQRQWQVALAGFQRDGRGHHAGDAVDIAAHHHHRAHLGHRTAKGGEQHRQHRAALVGQQQQGRQQPARAHGGQFVAALAQRIGHQLARQRSNQRQHQHALSDDHRRGREQQAPGPQRPGPRQQQVHRQSHHHRRQGQQGVERAHHHAPPGKARHGQPGPGQQAQHRPDGAGRGRHPQRQAHDGPQRALGLGQQLQRQAPALYKCIHRDPQRAGSIPAECRR